jgi:hypothetical protein
LKEPLESVLRDACSFVADPKNELFRVAGNYGLPRFTEPLSVPHPLSPFSPMVLDLLCQGGHVSNTKPTRESATRSHRYGP